MTKSIGFMRRWAIERSPLPPPLIVELPISDLQRDQALRALVGQVEMPLLGKAAIDQARFAPLVSADFTADLAAIVAELLPTDLSLADCVPALVAEDWGMLPAPQLFNPPLSALEVYPQLLDLFTGLTAPGKAGKAYGTPVAQTILLDPAADGSAARQTSSKKCIHGLSIGVCDICSKKQMSVNERQKKRTKPVRTLDLFDLLLPYLQPPLDQLLERPVLFPTDRRPRDYQVTGIKFLAEREGALLGDEMGLGKTIQAIVALQVLYRRGDVRQTLILCPRSLLGTWEKEVNKWSPELYLQKVRGTKDEREILWRANSSIYLTTYESFRSDVKSFSALTTKFQIVILDEVQKIKNPNAELAHAIRRLHCRYRWGLSGTPLENKLEDLTAIYRYLNPKLFNLENTYTILQVKQAIAPHFLRRRTADVVKELPEKEINEIWLELLDAQQAAYQQAEASGKQRLAEADATRVHVFALISNLKKICNLEPASGESCKLDYLIEQLDSIVESGQKALIFSHLPNATLAHIESNLKHFNPALFDGSLSDKRREAIIDDFQNRLHPSILLMSVQAGGVGLTLTRANHVFHFDHWWNPATARQAEGRAHRIGQKQTVFVYDIYTTNTIEERIYKLLQSKQALFDAVIDDLSAEYVEKSINDADLFGLFDLAPPHDPDRPSTLGSGQRIQKLIQPQLLHSKELRPTQADIKATTTINRLSPTEFEQFVAGLYTRMGYKTTVTPQSRDHGVDIFAKRLTHLGVEELIIQCKHYPDAIVGEPAVRNLIGAWQEYRHAQYAVMVTSGRFSNDAVVFANKHQVKLIDRQELLQLQQQ